MGRVLVADDDVVRTMRADELLTAVPVILLAARVLALLARDQ